MQWVQPQLANKAANGKACLKPRKIQCQNLEAPQRVTKPTMGRWYVMHLAVTDFWVIVMLTATKTSKQANYTYELSD